MSKICKGQWLEKLQSANALLNDELIILFTRKSTYYPLSAVQFWSKIWVSYFLKRNPLMKFQNPILNFERTQMSKFAKGNNAKKCKGE